MAISLNSSTGADQITASFRRSTADGQAQQGAARIFHAGVAREFRRPFQAGLQGGFDREFVQAEVDVGGTFRQLAVGFQDAVAEQDAELGEMAGGRGGIHRVDGGGVAGGGVHEEHRGSESLLQVVGDDSGRVAEIAVLAPLRTVPWMA